MTAPHLVLVDDNEDILDIYSELLEMKGYRVSVFAAARPAFDFIRIHASTVDLVISDVKMPGMDGLEFLAKVQETEPNLPFILLTGHLEPVSVASSNIPVVSKPIEIAKLVALIEKARAR